MDIFYFALFLKKVIIGVVRNFGEYWIIFIENEFIRYMAIKHNIINFSNENFWLKENFELQ
jgi:hypothetical protein